jgi:hypothetical protein
MYKQQHFVLQVGILYTRAQRIKNVHKLITKIIVNNNNQVIFSWHCVGNLCNQLGNWAQHKKTFYIGTAASILRWSYV